MQRVPQYHGWVHALREPIAMNTTYFVIGILSSSGVGLVYRAQRHSRPEQYADAVVCLSCALLLWVGL